MRSDPFPAERTGTARCDRVSLRSSLNGFYEVHTNRYTRAHIHTHTHNAYISVIIIYVIRNTRRRRDSMTRRETRREKQQPCVCSTGIARAPVSRRIRDVYARFLEIRTFTRQTHILSSYILCKVSKFLSRSLPPPPGSELNVYSLRSPYIISYPCCSAYTV